MVFMHKVYIGVIFLIFFSACTETAENMELLNGDIIFCNYDNGDLSSAIDEVTQTSKSTHYSHMGIVEIIKADTFIIHASLKRGVVKESLVDFMRLDNPVKTDVYRLNPEFISSIADAIVKSNAMVGLAYNDHYVMNDSTYYCSQLVYKAFDGDRVFSLEPMTFKNPNSEEFNQGWVKHYSALEIDIPEGEPGCNPNGLAASPKLKLMGSLR